MFLHAVSRTSATVKIVILRITLAPLYRIRGRARSEQ
jgi:hypothetical protein